MSARVLVGDCLSVMLTLSADSVDAVVTDPPYHLTTGKKGGSGAASVSNTPAGRARIGTGFMGKAWDGGDVAFRAETWAEVLRVAKPGAHLVAFGGTRTFHRLTCAIEDGGWEIRDCLSWLYGSGFPKSHDVSKAIDKAAGASREKLYPVAIPARNRDGVNALGGSWQDEPFVTAPATDAAREWAGWGTALKPAWEPIILARKPLVGTVAANVTEHGTGALNIDGCRIESEPIHTTRGATALGIMNDDGWQPRPGTFENHPAGRWPANVILDEEAARLLDEQSGTLQSGFMAAGTEREGLGYRGGLGTRVANDTHGDSGGASRFFYTAKASNAERNAGLDGFDARKPHGPSGDGRTWDIPGSKSTARRNHHPTVKPLDLMQWLVRLVTPRGGLVLDPFCGSGSTGRAAVAEGCSFIGIELEPEYAAIARARIAEYAPLFSDGAA